MDQEKAEKAKGQQADNRTFFGKYVSKYNIISTNTGPSIWPNPNE